MEIDTVTDTLIFIQPVLRICADGAQNEDEKRRLLELCSAQGLADFTNYVRKVGE